MGVDIMANLSEFVSVLPSDVAGSVLSFITVLKAVGIALIVYVVYLVVMAVVNFRRVKKLKVIERKVDSIDRKLSLLIRRKKIKNKK